MKNTQTQETHLLVYFYTILDRELNLRQINLILETCLINEKLDFKNIKFLITNLSKHFIGDKLEVFELLLLNLKNQIDLDIFILSLQLIEIKPFLLQEAKFVEITDLSNLKKYNPLSLEYDEISKSKPYFTRVNGALLSSLLFSKIESEDYDFIPSLSQNYLVCLFQKSKLLAKNNIELNQIFMLMFNESLNQSIISDSGSNYEERVLSVILELGIKAETIKKTHDEKDKSTEYDFYFELGGRKYGIGAKRTLRERYKQFIKTTQTTEIDVILEFTLGTDLTEEKAKTIRQHSTYLIVSDEIYSSRKYLQEIYGIFPTSQFTLDLIKKL